MDINFANQIITLGAGVVALALVFFMVYTWYKQIGPTLNKLSNIIENSCEINKNISKTLESITRQLIEHDARTQQIMVKIDDIEQTQQSINERVIRMETIIFDKKAG